MNYQYIKNIQMDKLIPFVILSIVIVTVSRRSLLNFKTHGFYRFISWECIAWLFKYIRHPLYSSLLFLTWGILLKNPTLALLIVSFIATVFLYLTAVWDEKECKVFFGQKYNDYMKRTKRFIPFIF